MRLGTCPLGLLLVAWMVACRTRAMPVPEYREQEASPGGLGSTRHGAFTNLELPLANLPLEAKPLFYAGRALAGQPWVKAPTITEARDGLGPLYNARTCLACHAKGGRGHPPVEAAAMTTGLLRLSLPGSDPQRGAVPEPIYGLQLQSQSTALSHQLKLAAGLVEASVAPEGQVFVRWQEESWQYPDGRSVALRVPKVELKELAYGALSPGTRMSLRMAPPIAGVGLAEQIAVEDIERLADPADGNEDGISGRVNRVWDRRSQRQVPGRFGYKANLASVEMAVAGAFAGDIGITNPLFPEQPCSPAQARCQRQPHGSGPDGFELSESLLELVVNYTRHLGVPQRTQTNSKAVLSGRAWFHRVGCAQCHHPSFMTQASEERPYLGGQEIWPYSDYLLHDLGPGLADGRSDYQASGSEWKTAPLWGLSNARILGKTSYLHDGRARTLEEAVLWHGGEAEASRGKFASLANDAREALLSFVRSL